MAYTKEKAKEKIKELVKNYEELKSQGKIRTNDEEQIKQHFIEPLFEFLGWDMRNPEEVIKEDRVGRKKVDFAFKLNDVTRFFVEAKAYNIDLLSKEVVEQALNYGWNKGITWTLLTNFERIFVLNSEWKVTGNLLVSNYKTLYYDRFADDQFELLWLLSKESFLENKLDEKAEKEERKPKRMPVTSQLFQDLTDVRDILRADIVKNNKSLVEEKEIVDEIIQRIIDKLIFIRKTEDLGLEDYPLKSALHLYKSQQLKQLTKKIQNMFIEFDTKYNSEMFKSEHISNSVKITDSVMHKAVRMLYSPDERFVYNFAQIEADVLGNIYEQYLSLLLKGGNIRGKFTASKKHRKEQGIYYTPTYIVDYIVKNTIERWIKDRKNKIGKIKVLDPACGSGSFLIRALDFVYNERIKNDGKEYQSKLEDGRKARTTLKSDIVKNNIFGVDLDEKAVDVAQLNLLLKTAETRQRLPTLRENIRIGDSIIDDKNVRGKKAFDWDEKFKNIEWKGSFDIVIGNPPYFNLRSNPLYQKYCEQNYPLIFSGQDDILYYFLHRGINILKEGGYLGFIISRYFLESVGAKKLRDFILKNCEIIKIVDFGNNQVFDGVNILTAIIILKKRKGDNKFPFYRIKDKRDVRTIINQIERNSFNKNDVEITMVDKSKLTNEQWIFISEEYTQLIKKIMRDSIQLGTISKIGRGIQSGLNSVFVIDNKTQSKYNIEKKVLRNYIKTMDIKSYAIYPRNLKVIKLLFEDDIENYPNTKKYMELHKKELKKRYEAKKGICKWYSLSVVRSMDVFDVKKEKIITPIYSTSNKFGYDGGEESENYFTLSDTTAIQVTNKEYNTKAILAILNSNLMNFYFKKNTKLKRDNYCEYITESLQKIPIRYNKDFESKIVSKVELLLNKLKQIGMGNLKSDKNIKIEKEILELKQNINQEVYKLYGITNKEKEIIEKSLPQTKF